MKTTRLVLTCLFLAHGLVFADLLKQSAEIEETPLSDSLRSKLARRFVLTGGRDANNPLLSLDEAGFPADSCVVLIENTYQINGPTRQMNIIEAGPGSLAERKRHSWPVQFFETTRVEKGQVFPAPSAGNPTLNVLPQSCKQLVRVSLHQTAFRLGGSLRVWTALAEVYTPAASKSPTHLFDLGR